MDIFVDDKPVWEPLEMMLGKDACKDFMYIGKAGLGEIWVFLYKHRFTRRYLNLDGKGNAYAYDCDYEKGGYKPINFYAAIKHIFS